MAAATANRPPCGAPTLADRVAPAPVSSHPGGWRSVAAPRAAIVTGM